MATKRKLVQLKEEYLPTPINADGGHNSPVALSQAKKARLSLNAEARVREQSLELPPSATGTEGAQRTDAPASAPPPTNGQAVKKIAKKFVKHDSHWLLDGNTLVQIGETRFRLHRSTLVKQSNWFREMIESPPHDRCIYADEETGATVYCLDSLDVNVKDFVALLNALDDAISYAHDPPSFKTVASTLRAADALEFNKFRDYAVKYLKNKWSSNIDYCTTYAADTVQLARQRNVSCLLKRALYELVRAEGFRQKTDPDADDNSDDETDSVRFTLSASDVSILLYAREQLSMFWMGKALPPPQVTACVSPQDSQAYRSCATTRNRSHAMYRTLVHDSKVFERYRYDPVFGLDALYDAPWVHGEAWPSVYGKDIPTSKDDHLCHACAAKWRSGWQEEGEKLWDDLDTWFELNDEEERDGAEG